MTQTRLYGATSAASSQRHGLPAMKITLSTLNKMKRDEHKIAMLTCYDATFAAIEAAAGVDILLIGDSLGNVVQGHASTLPVTLEDMIYHTAAVARGAGP